MRGRSYRCGCVCAAAESPRSLQRAQTTNPWSVRANTERCTEGTRTAINCRGFIVVVDFRCQRAAAHALLALARRNCGRRASRGNSGRGRRSSGLRIATLSCRCGSHVSRRVLQFVVCRGTVETRRTVAIMCQNRLLENGPARMAHTRLRKDAGNSTQARASTNLT